MDFSQIKNVLGGVLETVSEKGKGYLETVSEKGKEVVDTAKDKTRTAGRVAKLSMELNSEKSVLEETYAELGKVYYEECANSAMGIFAQLCEEINAVNARMEMIEAEIAQLKGTTPEEEDIEVELVEGEFCCPEQAAGTCCCFRTSSIFSVQPFS